MVFAGVRFPWQARRQPNVLSRKERGWIMAKEIEMVVHLIDDLDGSRGEKSYEFRWEGVDYELDLSAENAHEFELMMKPYVSVARPVKKGTKSKKVTAKIGPARPAFGASQKEVEKAEKARRDEIRDWGRANGFHVAQFSRIPQAVIDAYRVAHSKPTLNEAVKAELQKAHAAGDLEKKKK
jgi:hypothetical protein